MKENKLPIFAIIVAIAITVFDLIWLRQSKLFFFLIGIAAFIVVLPFLMSLLLKVGLEKEIRDVP